MAVPLRILLITFIAACSFPLKSQSFYKYKGGKNIHVLFGAGLTSYSGDLSKNHAFKTSNPHVSAGIQANLTSRIGIRGEMAWYTISGADNEGPAAFAKLMPRNLSFTADNLEFTIAPMVYLLPERSFPAASFPFNLYFTAGVGMTWFNPKAQYQGKYYNLRPLETEGVKYGQFAFIVPAGLGIKYKLNTKLNVALEAGYRFTFTDYLDDVSSVYIAQSSFGDPVASVLADRRQELGFKPAPAGTPRGNPKANDGYLMLGLKAHYNLSSATAYRMRRFR